MISLIHSISNSKRVIIYIPTIILLLISLKLFFITADAPQDLTISASIYTDEGFKTLSARNKVLFGNWKWTPLDEYESWAKKSPLSAWIFVKSFKLFGPSIFSIRIVSVLYGSCTLLLFFIFP